MMDRGSKVKIKYGGGHIGVITDTNLVRVSFSSEGKPNSGVFSLHELVATTEDPVDTKSIGFHSLRVKDEEEEEDND